MGDDMNRRTRTQLADAPASVGANGIERVKAEDDWQALRGLQAVKNALLSGVIGPRVCTRAKFHAIAYHFKTSGLVDHGTIGSRKTMIEIIDPHIKVYSPFETYLKTLHDYFAGRERAQDGWEANHSVIYKMLSQYQRDGYHRALQIADANGGALVCDGVGLGKTFIGLMVLERRLYEPRKRMEHGSALRDILLIVPKSAEQSVWRANIDRYLKPTYARLISKYLHICRHTDFGREGTLIADKLEELREDAGTIIIGSVDGKKYRNFAQCMTFDMMIRHANRQLSKMTDRYMIARDEMQLLELNVVDSYQAGETRSAKNLSGGESFIVSLALALGLSQMSSRKVRIDSLFLDEGFGTLDDDALDTALNTLAELRSEGKMIGVISHVPALKERITTQIQVSPLSGGKSAISGPGCKKNDLSLAA
jgi:ABC-type polar amino acid transport system ATPase subunit